MLLTLLPELIPAAVDAGMTIAAALIDNLPLLIDAAVQLVTALVGGIGSALPQLIPAAVSIRRYALLLLPFHAFCVYNCLVFLTSAAWA